MPRFERRYRPTPGKIIIKRDEAVKVTKGGIHVAGAAEKPTFTGTVIAVGEGCKGVNIGDRVVYGGMYQMLGQADENDKAVLMYPDEVMYVFEDVNVSTPEELALEAQAKADFEAERNRPKLEL
jgi:co-chaperonin GroES (HSP10)